MIRILALEKNDEWQRVLTEAIPSGSQITFLGKNEALNSILNEQYDTVILDVPHQSNSLSSLLPQLKNYCHKYPSL
jgi:CheY-like chemotaxis protein